MKKITILLMVCVGAYCHADTVKPVILKQDALDFNKVEPLTGSTYAELLKEREKKGEYCIVARVVSRGNNSYATHYFDAGLFNALLFKNSLYPEEQKENSLYLNPLNGNPIVGHIDYIVLNNKGGALMGSDKDLMKNTQKSQFLRLLLDAHYAAQPQAKAQACLDVAHCYSQGVGTRLNQQKALTWYQHAATQDNNKNAQAHANMALAELYKAQTPNPDNNKAHAHYQKAADQQADLAVSARASLSLAENYRLGLNAEKNFEKAAHYYQNADLYGDQAVRALAHMGLAELYRVGGTGIEKDFAKALELYTVGLSYKDNPEVRVIAMHGIGEIYRLGGFGIEKDYERAVSYYHQAADQTHNKTIQAIAQAGLGEMYRQGGFGASKDDDQAKKWYAQAMDQKDHVASQRMAQLGMAELYRCSDGKCAHAVEAKDLYSKIVECGDGQCGYPVACNGLGYLYCRGGKGLEKDLSKAVAWYSKASEQNKDAKARVVAFKELADIYRFSTEVTFHDIEKATQFYEMAADQNDEKLVSLQASQALGDIFAHGEGGIKRDYEKAVEYYLPVAKNGDDPELQNQARAALLEIRNSSRSVMKRMNDVF